MLTSDHPGGNYIEIHSLANHTLDLDGVALQRWNAGLAPTDAPSSADSPPRGAQAEQEGETG